MLLHGAPAQIATDNSEQLLSLDHYVGVRSTVPSISGQMAQIYVRERTKAGTVLRGGALWIGLLYSSTVRGLRRSRIRRGVSGYSWMAYLAKEGFDVFSLDIAGYGHRPGPRR